MSETVYLGLGCNVGDCVARLEEAARQLASLLDHFTMSSFYRTSPREYVEQAEFVNAVARGSGPADAETTGTADFTGPAYLAQAAEAPEGAPLRLLSELQKIEAAFGRDRAGKPDKGPRTMDIDLLLFGERIIETPELTVPHPAIHRRAFVLVPLLELEPGLTDPRSGARYQDSLDALPPQGVYYLMPSSYTLA